MENIIRKIYKKKSTLLLLTVLVLTLFTSYIYKNREMAIVVNGSKLAKVEKVLVSISGQVKKEGEYALEKGSKLADLVKVAGGVAPKAGLEMIDLQRVLVNGDKIIIPMKTSESEKLEDEELNNNDETMGDSKKNIDVVNINKGTKTELDSLPGIGEKTAQKIIEYRQKQRFKNIEEIKNVVGIGDVKYSNIKSYITI